MVSDLFTCKNKNCLYERLEDCDEYEDSYTFQCPKCGNDVIKTNTVDTIVYLLGR